MNFEVCPVWFSLYQHESCRIATVRGHLWRHNLRGSRELWIEGIMEQSLVPCDRIRGTAERSEGYWRRHSLCCSGDFEVMEGPWDNSQMASTEWELDCHWRVLVTKFAWIISALVFPCWNNNIKTKTYETCLFYKNHTRPWIFKEFEVLSIEKFKDRLLNVRLCFILLFSHIVLATRT